MPVAKDVRRPNRKKANSKRAPSKAKRLRRSRTDILGRIVEAATDEFNRYGYAATTTATIAANAGVTEAQLFRYFGSKSDLFRETIFNPLSKHLKNFLAEHLPDGADGRDLRKLYAAELQRFVSEHSGALTSLIFAETYDHGSDVRVSQIDSLRTYFERGAATMRLRTRRKLKVDPDFFVRISFVTVLGCVMFKRWIFPRGIGNADEVSAAINDFVAVAIDGNDS